MRDPFNRFALRYLAAVVCGLALLLLHSTAQSGLPAAFVPQCPSPWELSKLAFWPLLAAWVLTGRLGRERRTLLQDLPAAVLTPLAMTAACWGLAAAGGNGAASLAVWAVLLAAGTAFATPAASTVGALSFANGEWIGMRRAFQAGILGCADGLLCMLALGLPLVSAVVGL